MPNQAQETAFTLQEILLGLSDSLNQAQMQLRDLPLYDQNGMLQPRYELPYLDFNLQVTASFETSSSTSGQKAVAHSPYHYREKPMLMMLEPSKPSTHSSTKNQIVSTISGRFVATMPNQGVPQVMLQCALQDLTPINGFHQIELSLLVVNTVGEIIPNVLVEFNFNKDKTAALSQTLTTIDGVSLSISEGQTDANGIVKTIVSLPSSDYTADNTFIFEINAGIVNKSISITKIVS